MDSPLLVIPQRSVATYLDSVDGLLHLPPHLCHGGVDQCGVKSPESLGAGGIAADTGRAHPSSNGNVSGCALAASKSKRLANNVVAYTSAQLHTALQERASTHMYPSTKFKKYMYVYVYFMYIGTQVLNYPPTLPISGLVSVSVDS